MVLDELATTAPATSPAVPALNRTLWIVQVLMAVFFLVAAIGPKLVGEAYAVEMFTRTGAGRWLRHLVGVLEFAGAIGLLLPRRSALAALGLVGVMIGAAFTQVVVLSDPVMATTPLVLAVLAVVAWGRRAQLAVLLGTR
jgi:putative oxidoreductase